MTLTLFDLEKIFGQIPQDPREQKLFLEMGQGLADENGLEYLEKNKAMLLDQWTCIIKELS